jgi:F0F1-type ATP synthase membrane subunit b/b'
MQDAKYIIDENIKNKEEELIRKIKDFQEKIADND